MTDDNNQQPKKRIWDKLLMGAIIGGGIGSVVGASIAPKKGKETRKDIVDAAKSKKKSGILLVEKIKKIFKLGKKNEATSDNQHNQHHSTISSAQIKKIPNEEKEIK